MYQTVAQCPATYHLIPLASATALSFSLAPHSLGAFRLLTRQLQEATQANGTGTASVKSTRSNKATPGQHRTPHDPFLAGDLPFASSAIVSNSPLTPHCGPGGAHYLAYSGLVLWGPAAVTFRSDRAHVS